MQTLSLGRVAQIKGFHRKHAFVVVYLRRPFRKTVQVIMGQRERTSTTLRLIEGMIDVVRFITAA